MTWRQHFLLSTYFPLVLCILSRSKLARAAMEEAPDPVAVQSAHLVVLVV